MGIVEDYIFEEVTDLFTTTRDELTRLNKREKVAREGVITKPNEDTNIPLQRTDEMSHHTIVKLAGEDDEPNSHDDM